MAEHRAAVNALVSIYTVKGSNLALTLDETSPSSTLINAALPSSLHTDFPLGASLRQAFDRQAAAEASESLVDPAQVVSGTGVHTRESAFVGTIGQGRSEVLLGSGSRKKTWFEKESAVA
jgi:hypothetical protein